MEADRLLPIASDPGDGATGVLCLVTIPISETVRTGPAAIQIASGLGLLFTVSHIVALVGRSRSQQLNLPVGPTTAAGFVDIAILIAGAVGLSLGSTVAFEWLLILMLARPMVAFAIVFPMWAPIKGVSS